MCDDEFGSSLSSLVFSVMQEKKNSIQYFASRKNTSSCSLNDGQNNECIILWCQGASGSCGSGVEPAACYRRVAGSISLVCMAKNPWASLKKVVRLEASLIVQLQCNMELEDVKKKIKTGARPLTTKIWAVYPGVTGSSVPNLSGNKSLISQDCEIWTCNAFSQYRRCRGHHS